MKKLAILILILPFLSVEAEAAPKLETLFCNAGYDECASNQTRRAWVEARARLLFGCETGFESSCAAEAGDTYETHVHVNGTTVLHNCENKHYIHEIGIVAVTDPITGASGVDFIVGAGVQPHCSTNSCNPNCNCTGLQ